MKNHKLVIATVFFFFLFIIFFLSFKVITKISDKEKISENIKKIPEFSYITIFGESFTNQMLKPNIPTIFFYFNTDCDHCVNETEVIKENIKKFEGCQLIFISIEDPIIINNFAIKHKLISYDNITFLYDPKISFSSTFDVNSFPTIILYDKDKLLIEKIKGEIKIEGILRKINK